MMRFIVLGEIPGTHYIVTFSWVLGVAASLLVLVEVSIIISRRFDAKSKTKKITSQAL